MEELSCRDIFLYLSVPIHLDYQCHTRGQIQEYVPTSPNNGILTHSPGVVCIIHQTPVISHPALQDMANCNAKGALSDAEMPSFSLQEGTFWNAGGIILIYRKIRVTFFTGVLYLRSGIFQPCTLVGGNMRGEFVVHCLVICVQPCALFGGEH